MQQVVWEMIGVDCTVYLRPDDLGKRRRRRRATVREIRPAKKA